MPVLNGVTRDSFGNPLAGVSVKVFRADTDTLVASGTSADGGAYSITTPGTGPYYAVAYKVGSPDVAGTTVNTLVAVQSGPVFTSPLSQTINENAPLSLLLETDQDPSVSFAIVGGPDQSAFSIATDTLAATAFDYESPTDSDGDNVYQVTVRATNTVTGLYTDQSIQVTVSNVTEAAAGVGASAGAGSAAGVARRLLSAVGTASGSAASSGAGASAGGGPAWLPAGATTYADFVAGNYYAAGATQSSSYFVSSGIIDASGLAGDVVFTAALKAAVAPAGTTFFFETLDAGYASASGDFLALEVSAGSEVGFYAGSGGNTQCYDGTTLNLGTGLFNVGGVNKYAYRHDTGSRSFAAKGVSATGAYSHPTISNVQPRSFWCGRYSGTPQGYIRKMVVYGSALSDAQLVTLTT